MPDSGFARVGYSDSNQEFKGVNIRAQDVKTTGGVSAETHIADTPKHLTSGQAQRITDAVQASEKGAVDGVATLDQNQKLLASQIPTAITGNLNYQGRFDAETGLDGDDEAIPAAAVANKGYYWIASVEGEFTPPGSSDPMSFEIGDWLVSSGERFDKIDNTTADLIARAAAEAAMTEAEKPGAVFVNTEAELETKNLKPGAVVLMAVQNTTVDNP